MAQMDDSRVWGWFKFFGELLLLGLAILWFIQQPQFEPAIVVLASAGSILIRVVTRESHRTIFALLAVIIVSAVTAFGIRKTRSLKPLETQLNTHKPVAASSTRPRAVLQTGLMKSDYLLADDGSRLLTKALEKTTLLEIREAAIGGNEEAQYLLAVAYRDGKGFVADERMAAHWFRESANLGFARSQFAYGQELLFGSNPQNKAEGITWTEAATDQGVAPAAIALGRAYFQGIGISKDTGRAANYFEKALDLGYPEAGYWLAILLLEKASDSKGHNDLANYERYRKKALDYLLWSADKGIAMSQYELGSIYQYGICVPKDLGSAVKWYRKAARAQFVDAYISLAQLLEQGTDSMRADPDQASKYWRLASEKGAIFAKLELADRIKAGKLQPAFRSEFVSLCESALAEGSTRAASILAKSYWKGEGVTRDLSLAVRYAIATIDLVNKAEPGSEDGYPLYAVEAAHLLEEAQQAGVAVPSGRIDQFQVQYGSPQEFYRMTVKMTCAAVPTDVYIYVWDWGREEAPTEMQFDWYSKARGCEPMPGARKAFSDIYDVAKKTGASYKKLVGLNLSMTHE